MNPHDQQPGTDAVSPTRIPADIDQADRVLGPLTARQVAICAAGAVALYAGWWASRPWLQPLAYVVLVTPVAGVVAALALARREGVGMDRYLLAALAFLRTPRRRVHAPEGVPPLPGFVDRRLAGQTAPQPVPAQLPAQSVSAAGVVDLAEHGRSGLADCSTVNFELRTPVEQQALVAGFARWLNSLTGPVQLLCRTQRMDLHPLAARLHHRAASLPHPALETAARAHAEHLLALAAVREPLRRRLTLTTREAKPGKHSPASAARVSQRLAEAARGLAGADVDITPLTAQQTAAEITSACNPEAPAHREEEM